jgi:hypothetical protein
MSASQRHAGTRRTADAWATFALVLSIQYQFQCQTTWPTANPVYACAQEAARDIALLIPRSRLYAGESIDYVLGFVAGVLREDIRSGHARQSKDEAEVYNVWLDVMRIHWRIDKGTTVTVLSAEHAP